MKRADLSPAEQALLDAAAAARLNAHAPYSKFLVGAAVLDREGQITGGCNVENASYGLTNCAERTAFFAAIASGKKAGAFTHIAVTGDTAGPISPCGACRQVMMEMGGPDLVVLLTNLKGDIERTTANALLPGAFRFDT
jgi:cytidine deaminase